VVINHVLFFYPLFGGEFDRGFYGFDPFKQFLARHLFQVGRAATAKRKLLID